ncbi:hypothetical protein L7F22_028131 [Adiantum nelumboides]|nr:hypothetical protein [Adiantum nelumboides]
MAMALASRLLLSSSAVCFSKAPALLLLIFFLNISHGDILELPVGFNVSVRAASDLYGSVIKADSPLDGSAFFVPILSSSAFNSSNSSQVVGYSLGFLIVSATSSRSVANPALKTLRQQQLKNGFYLAVCGGMPGDRSNHIQGIKLASQFITSLPIIADGYVVSMWIANRKNPLNSANAALIVTKGQTLQLQDSSSKVVWMVTDAGTMEMQDTGNLVVYDAKNNSVIWQTRTEQIDTLIQGQKLSSGMELTSTNGDFSAHMEQGGLVLVLNSVQLADEPRSPYWIFPIHFPTNMHDSNGMPYVFFDGKLDMANSFINSAPCVSSNAEDVAYGMLGNASFKFYLHPGSCSQDPSFKGAQKAYIVTGRDDDVSISWSFLRLENDGRLYIYAVIMNNSTDLPGTPATFGYAFDNGDAVMSVEGVVNNSMELHKVVPFMWGNCDVPMACGPYGVCRKHETELCSCPSSVYFTPIDTADPFQGCQLSSSLPVCSDSVYRNTEPLMFNFLEMSGMSSIMFFSDWQHSSPLSTVELCRKACSISCSCFGFFHNKNTGICYLMQNSSLSLISANDRLELFSLVDLSKEMSIARKIDASIYSTYLKLNSTDTSSSLKLRSILVPTIASFVAALLILVVCSCCFVKYRRRQKQRHKQIEDEELRDILPLLPTRFSYKELQDATNSFGKLLGAGGCGTVYAGALLDGRKVAVKVLQSSLFSGQSKQFLAEVATVGRTNHLNVVRLVGFCWEVSHRLLVYEFVERGSLDRWLFGKAGSGIGPSTGLPAFLDWQTRYNVVLGIARGLSYLHEECVQPVLHFDIKPQNILLDEAFVAKLADFGMSRLMQGGESNVVTGVRGTPGYIAPEWLAHGAVSKKSDVYSMGMVFLEIIGGRKNVDLALLSADLSNATKNEAWHFPSWAAKKCEQGLMMEIVDERLKSCGFDGDQMERLIHTAFWCIQDDPSLRPHALTVVQWLDGHSSVKQPPFYSIFRGTYIANSGKLTSLS